MPSLFKMLGMGRWEWEGGERCGGDGGDGERYFNLRGEKEIILR